MYIWYLYACVCVTDSPAWVSELPIRREPLCSPRDICMHVCVLQTPRHELPIRGEPLCSPSDICMHVCLLQTPRHELPIRGEPLCSPPDICMHVCVTDSPAQVSEIPIWGEPLCSPSDICIHVCVLRPPGTGAWAPGTRRTSLFSLWYLYACVCVTHYTAWVSELPIRREPLCSLHDICRRVCVTVSPAWVSELPIRGEPLCSPRDICMHVCVIQTPRHGCLSSLYEENLSAPPWYLYACVCVTDSQARVSELPVRGKPLCSPRGGQCGAVAAGPHPHHATQHCQGQPAGPQVTKLYVTKSFAKASSVTYSEIRQHSTNSAWPLVQAGTDGRKDVHHRRTGVDLQGHGHVQANRFRAVLDYPRRPRYVFITILERFSIN